jgi:hypothetical protein
VSLLISSLCKLDRKYLGKPALNMYRLPSS